MYVFNRNFISISMSPHPCTMSFLLEHETLFGIFFFFNKEVHLNQFVHATGLESKYILKPYHHLGCCLKPSHARTHKLISTIYTNVNLNWMKAIQNFLILFLIGLLPSNIIINSFELSLSTNENKNKKDTHIQCRMAKSKHWV